MKTRVRQLPNTKWVAEVEKGFIFRRWYPIGYEWDNVKIFTSRQYQHCWWTDKRMAEKTEKDFLSNLGK